MNFCTGPVLFNLSGLASRPIGGLDTPIHLLVGTHSNNSFIKQIET